MKRTGVLLSPWILTAILLAVANSFCQQPSASVNPSVITLDPSRKFQTITGWEATAQAGQEQTALFTQYRDRLFELAVVDLGINRLRVFIKSGAENPTDHFTNCRLLNCSESERKKFQYEIVNDNGDPNRINPAGFHFSELDLEMEQVVLPIRRLLQERGERLYINVNYVDFRPSDFEHKNHPAEYAEFVLATYRHLQSKYNVIPDSWEVILEPDGSAWSAKQVSAAIAAAGKRLESAGFTPRFVAPSTTNMSRAPDYFREIANHPDAIRFMSEFSYHRYSGVSKDSLREIAGLAARYRVRTAMLEHIGSDYRALHQDLSVGRNSAWQQYTLAFPGEPDNESSYYIIRTDEAGRPVVSTGNRTRFLRHYFRYIRRGAVRIAADSNQDSADPLAFRNRNGSFVVVIKAERGAAFLIRGLPAGTYSMTYSTKGKYDTQLPRRTIVEGQQLRTGIPDAGVITVFAVAPTSNP